jgi:hypothetical protein
MLVRVPTAAALDEFESGFGIVPVTREGFLIDLVVLLVVNETVADRDRDIELTGCLLNADGEALRSTNNDIVEL